jgi:hypothetical protein
MTDTTDVTSGPGTVWVKAAYDCHDWEGDEEAGEAILEEGAEECLKRIVAAVGGLGQVGSPYTSSFGGHSQRITFAAEVETQNVQKVAEAAEWAHLEWSLEPIEEEEP